MKRFNVVVSREDGGVEVFPMKEWLRQHPQQVPPGLDATNSTSHQLRDGLRRRGWTVQETDSEVRLIYPDVSPPLLDHIGEVLGDAEDDSSFGADAAAFALERHLRDFIASNIGAIAVDGRKLELYVDPTGRDGIEFKTDVGVIDILAVDQAGDLVVFELKVDRGADRAVGAASAVHGLGIEHDWKRPKSERDHCCEAHRPEFAVRSRCPPGCPAF